MFLRLAWTKIHRTSGQPEGIFAAAAGLCQSGTLSPDDVERLEEKLAWFQENLPHPKKKGFKPWLAVFWFQSSAKENISRIWELVYFLREHSYVVEMYGCKRSVRIAIEDEFQVAAYPSVRDGKGNVR